MPSINFIVHGNVRQKVAWVRGRGWQSKVTGFRNSWPKRMSGDSESRWINWEREFYPSKVKIGGVCKPAHLVIEAWVWISEDGSEGVFMNAIRRT